MSISRLPSSTNSLLTTAPLFPNFETAVVTTASLLHRHSTSTNIVIHPSALRFKISATTPAPPLEELLPLSTLCSLELSTPTSRTLLRRGVVLHTDTTPHDGVAIDVWELFCCTPVRRRIEMARVEDDVIAATRERVVRLALIHTGVLSLVAGMVIYRFDGCLTSDALQVAFGVDTRWLNVCKREGSASVAGFVAEGGMTTKRYQLAGRGGVEDDGVCESVRKVWKKLPKEGRGKCAGFVIIVCGDGARLVESALEEVFNVGTKRVQGMVELKVRNSVGIRKRARFEDVVLQRRLVRRPCSEGRVSTKIGVMVGRPASAVEDAYKRMIPSWKNPCLPCRGRSVVSTGYDKRSVCMTRERIANVRIVGQVDNKFIVVGDEYGLYAVDQHAASERYLYELLLKRCLKERVGVKLANPRMVNVPCELRALATKVLPEARKWGWRIDDGFLVTHVPRLRAVDVVLEPESLIEWFEDGFRGGKQVPSAVIDVVASAACHAAVRFGDQLTKEMCRSIVTSLAECDIPFVCAHGRPNVVPIVAFDIQQQ